MTLQLTTRKRGRTTRCLLITVREPFDPPIQNSGDPVAHYGYGLRVWINVETGQQVKLQTHWELADGTEQVYYIQRALVAEKAPAPPPEVLDLLNRIVLP